MAPRHKATLSFRVIFEYRAAPVRCGAHGLVAYRGREQDRHSTAEDRATVLIRLHHDLLAALASAKRSHVSILTTMYGKSFTVDGFSQWMRDAIADAGLSLDCQPHGLRKAAGRRLRRGRRDNKNDHGDIGPHNVRGSRSYTEEADQESLADDAVIRLEGHKANRIAQTTFAGLEKCRKRKENQNDELWLGAP